MKRVIRRGVFETNSSSSHSLSIRKINGEATSEIDSDVSFEIRSPFAKVFQMLGLIDNAERTFKSLSYSIDEDECATEGIKALISIVNEKFPDTLKNLDLEKIPSYDLAIAIAPIINLLDIEYDFYEQFEDGFLGSFFNVDLKNSCVIHRFKELMLEELCRIEGKSLDEIMQKIEFEAFANKTLHEILKQENPVAQLEEYKGKDYSFKSEFKASGMSDIVEFARKYVVYEEKHYRELVEDRLPCDRYFCHGCLIDCDCGFEDYFAIANKLEITFEKDDEKIKEAVKKYMSNEYKVVAIEDYCGLIFEQTGEIY